MNKFKLQINIKSNHEYFIEEIMKNAIIKRIVCF